MKFFVRDGKRSAKKAFLIVMSIMALVVQPLYGLVASYVANAAPGDVVVRAASLQGWRQVGSGGSFSDVQAKIGNGSYRFAAGTAGQKHIAYNGYSGTKLADITELSYSSYIETRTGNSVAPLLRIDTRLNNKNVTLVWEPAYGPQSTVGSWQDYNPLVQGKWWATPSVSDTTFPNTETYKSWADVVVAYPTATIRSSTNGGVYLSAGQNSAGAPWTNFVGYVDNFKFNGTTYDFEPVAPVPPATPTNLRLNGDKICGYATNVNSITPTWDAVPGAVSYNYRVVLPGGGVYGPINVGNVTSVTGPFGAQGTSTFSVQAVAANGLTSDWATPCAVSYDVTDPSFAITNPANGSFVRGTQTIDAQITDDSDITKVLMNIAGDSRSWTNGSSSTITRSGDTFSTVFDTTTVADGPVYVTLRGTDGAGNTRYWNNNAANRQHVFIVDNTKPEISVSGYQGDLASKTFREVSFKLKDLGSKIDRAELNGKPFTSNHGSSWGDLNTVWANKSWSGAQQGANTLVLYDMAGNSSSYTFTIDTVAPTATLSYTPAGPAWTKNNVTVTLTASEPIKQSALPGTWLKVSDTVYKKVFPANAVQNVALEDLAGNTGSATVTINWIDKIAPTYTITNPIAGDTFATAKNGNKLIVRGSFNDNIGGSGANYIQLQLVKDGLDRGIVTTHGSVDNDILAEFDVTGFEDGEYYVNVLGAADVAGNWAEGPQMSIKVFIDNTAPIVTVNSIADSTNTTPVISGTTSEKGGDVTIFIDGNEVATVTSDIDGNWLYTPATALAVGPHTVIAVATDAVGNTSSSDTSTAQPYWTTFAVTAVTPPNSNTNGNTGAGDDEVNRASANQFVAPGSTNANVLNANANNNGNATTDTTPTTDEATDTDVLAATTTDGKKEAGEVLAAQDTKGNWSVVNLVLAVVTIILSLAALLGLARKKDGTVPRILTLVPVAIAVTAFLFIENLSASMIWLNWWTVLYAVVLAIQVAIVSSLKNSREY